MSSRTQIVGVSDVSIGYGSRQIPAFMQSLVDYYKKAEGIIIEPDQPEKPPQHDQVPELKVKRIKTSFNFSVPLGRIEYNMQAAREVNRLRPDILIIFCTYSLPVLFKLAYKPELIIYYSIESIDAYGPSDIKMNRCAAPFFDLIIFPEENRATKDSARCGFLKITTVILYNCADTFSAGKSIVPPQERNGRILYGGTVEKGLTYAEYFLRKEMQSVPVDIFGIITGSEKEETEQEFSKLRGSVQYYGYMGNKEIVDLRRFYSFSIVAWAPTNENQLYAAPNKFFESIAAAVPPIAAPHPQCKMIINRYKCGILMEDWNFDAFYAAIQQALKIYGTDHYNTMVANCRKAFAQELHWEKQFEKVRPFLREVA
jgi:glycosyltransferase involved in cell wall biosynthesis